jgi:hypothetical protein
LVFSLRACRKAIACMHEEADFSYENSNSNESATAS